MHHSSDPKRSVLALVHYIDDSGIALDHPYAIVGGPVFLQRDFFQFHYEWDRVLTTHKVSGPIHMREFGRPNGRLAYLSDDERRALFHDLFFLINKWKAWSLTVEIDHLEFQKYFPQDRFKKLFGVAPLAFIWCMILNHGIITEHLDKLAKIAYVVAKSDFNTAMLDSHTFIQSYEQNVDDEHTAEIDFDTPSNANQLQAADMVAWANRRKVANTPFNNGFESLELLTRHVESEVKPALHLHKKVDDDSTKELANIVGNPIRGAKQRIPLLQPFPLEIFRV